MPTYIYACETCGTRDFEMNVPISHRDRQYCAICGNQFKRKIAFNGLTWAPSAGGMR